MRILQINAAYNFGSTGRNVRELHSYFLSAGHESYVAAAHFRGYSDPDHFYQIGTAFDQRIHSLQSRVTGLQAYGSVHATHRLCRYIDKIGPDIIHLQNVHSHYLNLPILLDFVARRNGALIVSVHDCWFLTGRCVHFVSRHCGRWRQGCGHCPKNYYGIKSWFFDRSAKMAREKRDLFASVKKLGVIAVSDWILRAVKESYVFRDHPALSSTRIYNWINPAVFTPHSAAPIRKKLGLAPEDKIILGVSIFWNRPKGLPEFLRLAENAAPNEKILLIGNRPSVPLPPSVIPVGLISSESVLADYYSAADVFFSGSTEESFGKSTAESLMCGTPVVCYNSTSGPELVDDRWGKLVPPGDFDAVQRGIRSLTSEPKERYSKAAREFAVSHFDPAVNLPAHIDYYHSVLKTE